MVSPAVQPDAHVPYCEQLGSAVHDENALAHVPWSAVVSQVPQSVVEAVVHWPCTQDWLVPQITVHEPQWSGSLERSKQPSGHIVSPGTGQPWMVAASVETVDSSTHPTGCTVAVVSEPWVDAVLSQPSCSRVTAIVSDEPPIAPRAALTASRGTWKDPVESSAGHVTTPPPPRG
jgi:hypothetical protein